MWARCASALTFVHLVLASTLLSQNPGEPRLVRGPYLQALFHDTVEIRWVTDLETEGRVTVEGPDGETFDVSVDQELNYHVVVDGLRPRTEYTYRIYDGDDVLARSSRFRFRTAPLPGEGSFRAVVVGDSGIASNEQYDIAGVMTSFEADIFLHTGDILYLNDVDTGVFRPYRELLSQTCFFPSRGNHDFTLERSGAPWRSLFTLPNDSPDRDRVYYSYDWGPAHFLVLDYFSSLVDTPEQDEFAVADLRDARSRGVRWLIIYQHVPIYTVGNYSYLRHPIRRKLKLWCDEFDVDLVFGGHDHNYQRTHPVEAGVVRDAWQGPVVASPRGTVYVVTGGGGARLYPENKFAAQRKYNAVFAERHHCVVLDVSHDELRWQAVGFDNEVYDEYTILKDAPRPPISYLRGDATGDGVVDLADSVATLEALFTDVDTLPCLPAASGFDDGSRITITHPLFLLWYLFQGGPPPLAPYPDCGPIPDADDGFCYEAGC